MAFGNRCLAAYAYEDMMSSALWKWANHILIAGCWKIIFCWREGRSGTFSFQHTILTEWMDISMTDIPMTDISGYISRYVLWRIYIQIFFWKVSITRNWLEIALWNVLQKCRLEKIYMRSIWKIVLGRPGSEKIAKLWKFGFLQFSHFLGVLEQFSRMDLM